MKKNRQEKPVSLRTAIKINDTSNIMDDRCISSSTGGTPIEFQSDRTNLDTNSMVLRLCEILRTWILGIKTDHGTRHVRLVILNLFDAHRVIPSIHWGLVCGDAYSNEFSWKLIIAVYIKFNGNIFLRGQLTADQLGLRLIRWQLADDWPVVNPWWPVLGLQPTRCWAYSE